MILLKSSVRIKRLTPEIYKVLPYLDTIFHVYGVDCVITSANDSTHIPSSGKPSRHYSDYALDLRSHHLPVSAKDKLLTELRNTLGPDYQVILESRNSPNEHYHLEYDPE